MVYVLIVFLPLLMAVIQILEKEYNEKTTHISSRISIFIVVASVVSIIFYGFCARWQVSINLATLIYSAILACMVIFSNIVTIIALNNTDVIKLSVFRGAGGIILPFLFGIVFLDESVNILKYISAALLVFIIILPLFERRGQRSADFKEYLLLLLSFISAGIVTIFYKIYGADTRPVSDNMLCLWTNVLIIPFALVFTLKTGGIKQFLRDFKKIGAAPVVIALTATLLSAASTLWELDVLKYVSITLFTIFKNSLGLIFTAVLSAICFKEKITPTIAVSIFLSIVAIVLYSI